MGKGEIPPSMSSMRALKHPNTGPSFKYLPRAEVMLMDRGYADGRARHPCQGRLRWGKLWGGPPSPRGLPLDLKCDISWGKIKTRSK